MAAYTICLPMEQLLPLLGAGDKRSGKMTRELKMVDTLGLEPRTR